MNLQNDNWGAHARVGMFIVGSEAVPEAEWWAMLPPGVSVHAARITAKTPWASWRADRNGVELSDDLARGAAQFASMRLSAVVIGHSSSSFVGASVSVMTPESRKPPRASKSRLNVSACIIWPVPEPQKAMLNPSLIRHSLIPSPIPRPPPVTRATFVLSFMMVWFFG